MSENRTKIDKDKERKKGNERKTKQKMDDGHGSYAMIHERTRQRHNKEDTYKKTHNKKSKTWST